MDPWCSGLAHPPVTRKIVGSNPIGPANVIRRGIRRGKIKYWCKDCQHWFQINRSKTKEFDTKKILNLHLSGLSFRSLGEILGLNASTVYRKIKPNPLLIVLVTFKNLMAPVHCN